MAEFTQQDPNSVQGVLQQLLQSRDPAQRQQQIQQRDQAAQQYQQTLDTPAPTIDPITSMVSGYLQRYAANPSHGWNAVASAIGAQPEISRKQDEAQLLRKQQADGTRYEMANQAISRDDTLSWRLAQKMGSGKGGAGSFIQFKDDKGNLYIMNKATGDKEIIPATHSKAWENAQKIGYQKAVDEEMENPEEYSYSFANRVIKNSPGAVTTQETSQKPLAPVGQGPQVRPQSTPESDDRSTILRSEWKLNQGNLERFPPDSPYYSEALRNMALVRQELLKLGIDPKSPSSDIPASKPPASSTEPAQSIQYRDRRQQSQQKEYGSEEGKGLFKEREGLSQLSSANAKLLSQLDMLEKLYSNPNIPEGELANLQQQIRSGLVTLGVPGAKEVGAADFAKALGTSLSLTQKNADGHNLLPGAMSNYEDQLLQKMAPTLSLTNDGRTMLTKFMKQVAQSNMRIASEGSKMASGNKDMLPPNWYERKERIMREEMAKLKILSERMTQGVK